MESTWLYYYLDIFNWQLCRTMCLRIYYFILFIVMCFLLLVQYHDSLSFFFNITIPDCRSGFSTHDKRTLTNIKRKTLITFMRKYNRSNSVYKIHFEFIITKKKKTEYITSYLCVPRKMKWITLFKWYV